MAAPGRGATANRPPPSTAAPTSRGPTANQLQPPKRIQPDLLYSEDLEEMFGADAAGKGVHLEILNATGGTITVDPAGKEKRRAIMLKLGDGTKILEKKLGLNQTNKKALMAAFESEYVTEWVGWITLYVKLVEDRKNGGQVPAIRIKNTRPRLQPTFDYDGNIRKRQEAAARTMSEPPQQQMQEIEPEPNVTLSDSMKADIERQEREQFTAEPEGEES